MINSNNCNIVGTCGPSPILQCDGVASPSYSGVLLPTVDTTQAGTHGVVAPPAVEFSSAPLLFTIGAGDAEGVTGHEDEEDEAPRFTSDALFVRVSPRHSPNTGNRRPRSGRGRGRGRGKGAEADVPSRPRDARLRPKPKKTVRLDM